MSDAGITATALTDVEDEDARRQLWRLFDRCISDITSAAHLTGQPFAAFAGLIDSPQVVRDCSILARKGEQIVGFTITVEGKPEAATHFLTAGDPTYRNQGIAAALKIESLRRLQARGVEIVFTINDPRNAPVLAVDRRLGFVRCPRPSPS